MIAKLSVAVLTTLLATSSQSEILSGTPKYVFSCKMGTKALWLTAVGDNLVYHYGRPGNEEMNIIGQSSSGNIHYRLQDTVADGGRFTSAQIRFSNGPYSYIVVVDINERPQYRKIAHLVVAKGRETVSVKLCDSYQIDLRAYDFGRLPTDSEKFDASNF